MTSIGDPRSFPNWWFLGRAFLASLAFSCLDIAAPPVCVACGAPAHRHRPWCCDSCWNTSTPQPSVRALDIASLITFEPQAGDDLTPVLRVRACEFFRPPIRPILHALKYRGLWTIGPELGARMAQRLGPWHDIDAVVPIPMHAARRRERGYDQVRLIGSGLAHRAGLPPPCRWLRRKIHVPSQTGLDLEERRDNIRSCFAVRKATPGTRVILVDDVMTSGATLAAAAATLGNAGVIVVEAVTVAETTLRKTGDR